MADDKKSLLVAEATVAQIIDAFAEYGVHVTCIIPNGSMITLALVVPGKVHKEAVISCLRDAVLGVVVLTTLPGGTNHG